MCCSVNSWKILIYTKLICNQYTILTNTDVSSNIEVNQIRKLIIDLVCIITSLVFAFCYALTMGRCNVFQYIFGNEIKSEFYGPSF